jgi:hypothetical protein
MDKWESVLEFQAVQGESYKIMADGRGFYSFDLTILQPETLPDLRISEAKSERTNLTFALEALRAGNSLEVSSDLRSWRPWTNNVPSGTNRIVLPLGSSQSEFFRALTYE